MSLTNQTVSKLGCHVDHSNPRFEELIQSFIQINDIVLTPDLFPKEQDNQYEYDINDEGLKLKFYTFHEEKANLRITSELGNLTRKRK